MNKAKQSWIKIFLIFLLVGFGLGCISWTMFAMLVPSDYSTTAASKFMPGYTAERVK